MVPGVQRRAWCMEHGAWSMRMVQAPGIWLQCVSHDAEHMEHMAHGVRHMVQSV